MIRVLLDAPISYSLSKLRAEIQARYPETLDVNEVGEQHVAVYLPQGAEYDVSELQEILLAHDPTDYDSVTTEQRLDEIEEALALLHMEVSRK